MGGGAHWVVWYNVGWGTLRGVARCGVGGGSVEAHLHSVCRWDVGGGAGLEGV